MNVAVGVIAQKGGVGKSTLARLIACAYAAHDWSVHLADMDTAQASTVSWANRRNHLGIEPRISAETYRHPKQALDKPGDIVIFDGSPSSHEGTLDIARASDVVLLPTGVTIDDLEPQVRLAHSLRKHGYTSARILFVLSRVGNSEAIMEEARNYIAEAGYQTLEAWIPERTSFARAQDEGRALNECGHPSPRQTAQSVADAVIAFVNRATQDKSA